MRVLPRLVPDGTHFHFFRWRNYAFIGSGLVVALAVVFLLAKGLAFGIDFRGGILIEVRTPAAADLAAMRSTLGGLGLGEVALQEAGSERDVMIRIERQTGDEEAQEAAVAQVRACLLYTSPSPRDRG
jgi:preprotein translocase subunit SecF